MAECHATVIPTVGLIGFTTHWGQREIERKRIKGEENKEHYSSCIDKEGGEGGAGEWDPH